MKAYLKAQLRSLFAPRSLLSAVTSCEISATVFRRNEIAMLVVPRPLLQCRQEVGTGYCGKAWRELLVVRDAILVGHS